MQQSSTPETPLQRLGQRLLDSRWPLPAMLLLLLLGMAALWYTPREEEPQIVVPVVDIRIQAPGLSAREVERQVIQPLEQLIATLPELEHSYATSQRNQGLLTLRFRVGSNRDDALFHAFSKLHSHTDRIPPAVTHWQVTPVDIDDVAIVVYGLWSHDPQQLDQFQLRRLAEEMASQLQRLPNTNRIEVIGGQPRQLRIQLDPTAMAARGVSTVDVLQAIRQSNLIEPVGQLTLDNRSINLESGLLLQPEQLPELVVAVVDQVPISLGEVAQVIDGPAEVASYSWLRTGEQHPQGPASEEFPLVTLAISKQPGSNAVWLADSLHQSVAQMQTEWLPDALQVEVLRDYGETADEKVNNLTSSLLLAVLTVIGFIGIFLGWRQALLVALAVPLCYSIALGINALAGYSINRVTLFALILALGLLVDDPITGVDNIDRHLRRRGADKFTAVINAMLEIRWPLLMSTLVIIIAFVPLAFITDMMGPYMAPMALNVPVAVTASTLVAFLFTPWLAARLLKPGQSEAPPSAFYSRLLAPWIASRRRAWAVIIAMIVLLLLSMLLPMLRLVPLKLLPYDNKNELAVMVELPEGSSLEQTRAAVQQAGEVLLRLPEVKAVAAYVGEPAPIDFNGLVRRYYLRQAPELGELRLTLADKLQREDQSHAILLRLRPLLAELEQQGNARFKPVEVPPGPPVMSTLVVEISGQPNTPWHDLQRGALALQQRLAREPGVVDVDSSLSSEHQRLRFVPDWRKAALSGISVADINQHLRLAHDGLTAGHLKQPDEVRALPLRLELAPEWRRDPLRMGELTLRGEAGYRQQIQGGVVQAPRPMVALAELGSWQQLEDDPVLQRKDLQPVIYVMAEIAGRQPAEIIADVVADRDSNSDQPRSLNWRTYFNSGGGLGWSLPEGVNARWTGEGEWRVTVLVFRDLGLAFAFALVGMALVLRIQTSSWALTGLIMSAIPLSMIGLMPGFWLLNLLTAGESGGIADPVLFTATAMIGMIALAGIVVRNGLILVEFIDERLRAGDALRDALFSAGALRLRPVLLTAGTTLLGNLVITLDPVFAGLAWAIIFGLITSTLFTLVVVPCAYYLLHHDKEIQPPCAP